jgi:hypothetical protein
MANKLLLCYNMFCEDFSAVLSFELSDEAGIPVDTLNNLAGDVGGLDAPEFACYAKVFTAPHERIALACFCRCRNPGWIKVFLLSSCNCNQPVETSESNRFNIIYKHVPSQANQCVFSADYPWANVRLTSRCQTPASRPECLVQDASVLDFRKINQAVL